MNKIKKETGRETELPASPVERLVMWLRKFFGARLNAWPVRSYTVRYPVSFGAMTIHEEHYHCSACCKYHAYLQFIKDTKDGFNHYSARENRTPLTFSIWRDDIYT